MVEGEPDSKHNTKCDVKDDRRNGCGSKDLELVGVGPKGKTLDPEKGSFVKADFEKAIELTGYGKFHYFLLAVCGFVSTSEEMDVISMSFILPSAQCDLNLDTQAKGWLNSIIFIGMMAGAYAWGSVADALGRRKVLIAISFMNACCIVASSFSQSYELFMFFRFLNGAALGGSGPVIWSYFAEFQPKSKRGSMLSFMAAFWTLGNLFVAGLAWLIIPYKIGIDNDSFKYNSWRIFLLICAIPSFIVAGLLLLLPESPKYLLMRGRQEEALEIFRGIYAINTGKPRETYMVKELSLDDDYKHPEPVKAGAQEKNKYKMMLSDILDNSKQLFVSPILRFTVISIMINFTFHIGYYGLMMWFPELFNRFDQYAHDHPGKQTTICEVTNYVISKSTKENECSNEIGKSVFMESLITVASAIPANIVAVLGMDRLGRKFFLVFSTFSSGLCSIGLFFVYNKTQNLIVSAFFSGVISCGNAALDCLITEVFPTSLRATGVAISMVAARLGGIIGNIVIAQLLDMYCPAPTFIVAALLIGSECSVTADKISTVVEERNDVMRRLIGHLVPGSPGKENSSPSGTESSIDSSPSALKRRLHNLPPPSDAVKLADRVAALNRRIRRERDLYLHLQGLSNRIEEKDEAEITTTDSSTMASLTNNVSQRNPRDARARRRERMSSGYSQSEYQQYLYSSSTLSSPEPLTLNEIPEDSVEGTKAFPILAHDYQNTSSEVNSVAQEFQVAERFLNEKSFQSFEYHYGSGIYDDLRKQNATSISLGSTNESYCVAQDINNEGTNAPSSGSDFPVYVNHARTPLKFGGYRPSPGVVIHNLSSDSESDTTTERIAREVLHNQTIRMGNGLGFPIAGGDDTQAELDFASTNSSPGTEKLMEVKSTPSNKDQLVSSPSSPDNGFVVIDDDDNREHSVLILGQKVEDAPLEGRQRCPDEKLMKRGRSKAKPMTHGLDNLIINEADEFEEDCSSIHSSTPSSEALVSKLASSNEGSLRSVGGNPERDKIVLAPIADQLQSVLVRPRGSASTSPQTFHERNSSKSFHSPGSGPVKEQRSETSSNQLRDSNANNKQSSPSTCKSPCVEDSFHNGKIVGKGSSLYLCFDSEQTMISSQTSTISKKSAITSSGPTSSRNDEVFQTLNATDGLKIPPLDIESQDLSKSTSSGSRGETGKQALDVNALIRALSDVSLKRENGVTTSGPRSPKGYDIRLSGSSGPRSSEYTPAAGGSRQSLTSLEASEAQSVTTNRIDASSFRKQTMELFASNDQSPSHEEQSLGSCGSAGKHLMTSRNDPCTPRCSQENKFKAYDFRVPVAKVNMTNLLNSKQPTKIPSFPATNISSRKLELFDETVKPLSSRTEGSLSQASKSSKKSTRSLKSLQPSKTQAKTTGSLRAKTEGLSDLRPPGRLILDSLDAFRKSEEEPFFSADCCSNEIVRQTNAVGKKANDPIAARNARNSVTRTETVSKGSTQRSDISGTNSKQGSGRRSIGRSDNSSKQSRERSRIPSRQSPEKLGNLSDCSPGTRPHTAVSRNIQVPIGQSVDMFEAFNSESMEYPIVPYIGSRKSSSRSEWSGKSATDRRENPGNSMPSSETKEAFDNQLGSFRNCKDSELMTLQRERQPVVDSGSSHHEITKQRNGIHRNELQERGQVTLYPSTDLKTPMESTEDQENSNDLQGEKRWCSREPVAPNCDQRSTTALDRIEQTEKVSGKRHIDMKDDDEDLKEAPVSPELPMDVDLILRQGSGIDLPSRCSSVRRDYNKTASNCASLNTSRGTLSLHSPKELHRKAALTCLDTYYGIQDSISIANSMKHDQSCLSLNSNVSSKSDDGSFKELSYHKVSKHGSMYSSEPSLFDLKPIPKSEPRPSLKRFSHQADVNANRTIAGTSNPVANQALANSPRSRCFVDGLSDAKPSAMLKTDGERQSMRICDIQVVPSATRTNVRNRSPNAPFSLHPSDSTSDTDEHERKAIDSNRSSQNLNGKPMSNAVDDDVPRESLMSKIAQFESCIGDTVENLRKDVDKSSVSDACRRENIGSLATSSVSKNSFYSSVIPLTYAELSIKDSTRESNEIAQDKFRDKNPASCLRFQRTGNHSIQFSPTRSYDESNSCKDESQNVKGEVNDASSERSRTRVNSRPLSREGLEPLKGNLSANRSKSVKSETTTHHQRDATEPQQIKSSKLNSTPDVSKKDALGPNTGRKSQDRFPFTISESTSRKSFNFKVTTEGNQMIQDQTVLAECNVQPERPAISFQMTKQNAFHKIDTYPSFIRLTTPPGPLVKETAELEVANVSCVSYGYHVEPLHFLPIMKGIVRKLSAKLRKSESRQLPEKPEEPRIKILYKNKECRYDQSAKGSSSDSLRSSHSKEKFECSCKYMQTAIAKPVSESLSGAASGKTVRSKKRHEDIALPYQTPRKSYDRDDLWVQEFDSENEFEDNSTFASFASWNNKTSKSTPIKTRDRYSVFLAKGEEEDTGIQGTDRGPGLPHKADEDQVESCIRDGEPGTPANTRNSMEDEMPDLRCDFDDSGAEGGCFCLRICQSLVRFFFGPKTCRKCLPIHRRLDSRMKRMS